MIRTKDFNRAMFRAATVCLVLCINAHSQIDFSKTLGNSPADASRFEDACKKSVVDAFRNVLNGWPKIADNFVVERKGDGKVRVRGNATYIRGTQTFGFFFSCIVDEKTVEILDASFSDPGLNRAQLCKNQIESEIPAHNIGVSKASVSAESIGIKDWSDGRHEVYGLGEWFRGDDSTTFVFTCKFKNDEIVKTEYGKAPHAPVRVYPQFPPKQ